jgi:hypothetical protein
MLNHLDSWSAIAKWAAGSGVFGIITFVLLDEAASRRLIRLIRHLIVLLFVLLLLLLPAWWCYCHGGEQQLIHYFGRGASVRHTARHVVGTVSGQRPTAEIG